MRYVNLLHNILFDFQNQETVPVEEDAVSEGSYEDGKRKASSPLLSPMDTKMPRIGSDQVCILITDQWPVMLPSTSSCKSKCCHADCKLRAHFLNVNMETYRFIWIGFKLSTSSHSVTFRKNVIEFTNFTFTSIQLSELCRCKGTFLPWKLITAFATWPQNCILTRCMILSLKMTCVSCQFSFPRCPLQ